MTFEALETPCFILKKDEFRRSINGFQDSLRNEFQNFIVGYSVKTNSLPCAMKLANHYGCYAEVVSSDEYSLAIACGFDKSHIIYNGPMKSKTTFIEAIMNGAFVNIETKRELDWLQELPKDKIYPIGVRLSINISDISPNNADGENDFSRFGFTDETEEFSMALNIISKIPQVKLAGLHIHRTTHSRNISFYRDSVRYAANIIKKYRLNISYLDVGGGYFGIFRNKPTFEDYSKAIAEELRDNDLQNMTIIVEPGNALTASPFSFLTSVIDTKHIQPNSYVITTDGSRNDIDPFFKKSSYIYEIIYCDKESCRENAAMQIVSGCTCLEYDQLFKLQDAPLLKNSDRILYNNVGAYTMCLSPLFIRYFPKVYLNEQGEYKLVRDKWGEKEFMQKSIKL